MTITANTDQDQEIVLAYTAEEVVTYATELQTEFIFTTGDETNCPKDKLYLFNDELGTSVESEGAFSNVQFTMGEANQGKSVIYFAMGPMAKSVYSSIMSATITVCGRESVNLAAAFEGNID